MTKNKNALVFQKRRERVMRQLGKDGVFVIAAQKEVRRNGDAHYPYRQNSDFYYLTGFNEPDAVLVLAPKHPQGEFILFNRPRDHASEQWDGPRAGQDGARLFYGADVAFDIAKLSSELPIFLQNRETLYYTLGLQSKMDKLMMDVIGALRQKVRGGIFPPKSIMETGPILHEMRLVKDAYERACMQKAADITVAGHMAAMQACRPGCYEYEIEAAYLYACHRLGACSQAYGSIVGAGSNACILHYVNNNARVKDGDLVLMDAGCEYENYASDVTRTFPANGHFSAEQRAIYELVLEAQLAAIRVIKPGVRFDKAQQVIVRILTEGLVDLGILHGRVDDLIEQEAYAKFYMHRSGHWLGLDVHDAGAYKVKESWRRFVPNMALTVEPGLYLSENVRGLPKRFHNIGVRIEDDVLVTSNGSLVLSKNCPKSIADIEAWMAFS